MNTFKTIAIPIKRNNGYIHRTACDVQIVNCHKKLPINVKFTKTMIINENLNIKLLAF